jgi:protein involved in temperature-dependent protein secretion
VKPAIVTLLLAAMLSGCADQPVTVARAHHRNHVSPPPVAPPTLPDDSFDQAKAEAALATAVAARRQGDLSAARAASEAALQAWPVSINAWEELYQLCGAEGDAACRRYAMFFHAKLLVLAGLPMRAASLGFETIAESPEGTHVENNVYDRQTLAMASRLWVFCSQQDPAHSKAGEPMQESFDDAYPYAPALLVIGVGAGLLTGIKSLANK